MAAVNKNRSAKPDVLPDGAAKRALWRTCKNSGTRTCNYTVASFAVATNVKLMNNPLAVATNVKWIKIRLVRRYDDCETHFLATQTAQSVQSMNIEHSKQSQQHTDEH